MNLDSVHPELRPALAKLTPFDNSKPVIRYLSRVGPRLLRPVKVPEVRKRWVRDGKIHVRVYEPTNVPAGPGMLWIHGGGLVIGSAQQDDNLCSATARDLGIRIISVEYRMAPESPFPAALDDAHAAWTWLQIHAESLRIDPGRVVIAGESAGAGIATSLAQRLLDEGGLQPIAQWLFAPMLDDRTAADRTLDALDHPVWNNRANRYGWSAYLGQEPGAVHTPRYAVPARREDLRGMPPTWIYTGDVELFHDEIASYAEQLRAAGVEVEFDVVPGAAHGFENWAFSTTLAHDLIRRAQAWLSTRIS